jgi:H+-transporting ATPase
MVEPDMSSQVQRTADLVDRKSIVTAVSVPLASKTAGGLTQIEVAERLNRFGPNATAVPGPKSLRLFLGKFWGVVPVMLEATITIDLVLGKWIEAGVIGVLLVGNATMAFRQEERAQKAVALLRERLTVTVRILRDGIWQQIGAAAVVPDDVVYLRTGDIVPADLLLTSGTIELDQSQLTGESTSVQAQAGTQVHAGSVVLRGEATGLVTATGPHTYLGKTVELVRIAESPRRVDALIISIATSLGGVILILALIAFFTMTFRGTPLVEMLPFGVMLLVGSVPVMLPTMFTMTATLGARALAEEGILVARLNAIQDAASMDVICLDKTGTLTENSLSVGQLFPTNRHSKDQLLLWGALSSDAATQDPIDLAILRASDDGLLLPHLAFRSSFIPFDPQTKSSEASFAFGEGFLRVIKGTPRTIVSMTATPWAEVEAEIEKMAVDGARIIGVAAKTGDGELTLAGFIGLKDPPRVDSAALIGDLHNRGIRTLLVTGDSEATARAIARQVGIMGEVAPRGAVQEGAALSKYSIYAGVFPQDKFDLVKALQKAGHIVGMTGDGVNDAPALRQADVGIAVAKATDVAKAAAGLVLTRPGLSEIIAAVDGSRRIYQRMQNFTLAMVARKLSTPTFYALWIILAGAFVVNPVQMALLMLVGDLSMMFVAKDQVAPSKGPNRWNVYGLARTGIVLAVLLIALNTAVYWGGIHLLRLDAEEVQTFVFAWLVLAGSQGIVYLTRSGRYAWSRPFPAHPVLLASCLSVLFVVIFATQGVLMKPIGLSLVSGLLLLALAFLLIGSLLKEISLRARG